MSVADCDAILSLLVRLDQARYGRGTWPKRQITRKAAAPVCGGRLHSSGPASDRRGVP
jgi:hypothetical protein